ncbi:hypothetical protein B0H14DRAFT_1174967 [Mycena olivaceomarginata]|nr:hypothetical protein B0H14DRAFT_1174967 [Mycena olivaceomarginata]
MSYQDSSSELIPLVMGNLIPLHVVLAGLTWILHDYLVTVEDEIRYIWPQRLSPSKLMFFWIRYYAYVLSCAPSSRMNDHLALDS